MWAFKRSDPIFLAYPVDSRLRPQRETNNEYLFHLHRRAKFVIDAVLSAVNV